MASLVITPRQTSGTASNWVMDASLHSALSTKTNIIAKWLDELRRPSPSIVGRREGRPTLESRVFDALAGAKILTSQVAMHLEQEYRNRLFRQLDSLHETDQWEEDDEPLNQSSFQTFLKAILTIKPERRPGLGLSHTGNLIAAWTTVRDRLTIEFLPNDWVSWVLARYNDADEQPARFAGQTSVSQLVEGLAPHRPEHWFSHAGNNYEPSR
jgi:hypothetical protein